MHESWTYYILEAAYKDENFNAISTNFLVNISQGASLIKLIEKRFDILGRQVRKYKIYHSQNGSLTEEKFKKWYKTELEFISNLLAKLIYIIESEDGAIAGTKSMIEDLE